MEKQIDLYTADDTVRLAIYGTVPERQHELNVLWEKYAPCVEQTLDKCGFNIQAGSFNSLLFDHKSMYMNWLFGFGLMKGLTGFEDLDMPDEINQESINNIKTTTTYFEISEIFDHIMLLKESTDIIEFDENKVPYPKGNKPEDMEGAAAFDLLCMNAAFLMLHEFRHIQLSNMNHNFSAIEEEKECDNYAKNFIIEKISEYCKKSGYGYQQVLVKRMLAIGFCFCFMIFITPQKFWKKSKSHPSIKDRIGSILKDIEIGSNDNFWFYINRILIILICYFDIKVENIKGNQSKLFYSLIEKFE